MVGAHAPGTVMKVPRSGSRSGSMIPMAIQIVQAIAYDRTKNQINGAVPTM